MTDTPDDKRMTPEAKARLRKTMRGTENGTDKGLRGLLLLTLKEETERAYQLGIARVQNTSLNEERRAKRRRLEEWLDDQTRAETGKHQRTREDFLDQVVKQAAYTLLNRLVILRIMEATGLRKPFVVTGGWNSPGYKDFREFATSLCRHEGDPTEGYAFLLRLVFEDLALDLPGLYGSAGVADLIPVPASALRRVVEAFDDPELASCWTDDMTLGWVYQYWNDPDREALDDKINDGGKIEPHEIASKTQMFTERYMVDWLLQNSLGPMWLAMCRKHGWTPDVEANGTLDELERRRVEWRAKRDERQAALAVEQAKQQADPSYEFDEDQLPGVSLTELMPLHTDAERRWAYYVPQPIPDDAIEHASESVRDLKILDPAVGSGHFLVVAFDLLFSLYEEEARHRDVGRTQERSDAVPAGEANDDDAGTALRSAHPTDWSPQQITEHILEHNLHGIDLDPRAVQIAAAALWLKAQQVCPEAKPRQLNLVASNLRLGSLPDNDPALVELRQAVEQESGIPAALTDSIVQALAGADHLGSLLKVDAAIDTAIGEFERSLGWEDWGESVKQLNLFPDGRVEQHKFEFSRERVAVGVLTALESFLQRHTRADELGLRLYGEQLAAGVRFVRMVREGSYDLVVANPPYQGTSKMAAGKYIQDQYPLGKADLFAAFLLRGLELVREGGVSSMLTMRNWMFIKQYSELRQHLLGEFDLRALGDFDRGAFEDVPDEVVSVAVSSFARGTHDGESIALSPTPREDRTRDNERTSRKRAATLCHVGRHNFDPAALKVVPEWPLVYWWDTRLLDGYREAQLIGDVSPPRFGANTGNNARFSRRCWETRIEQMFLSRVANNPKPWHEWVPYVMGAKGQVWIDQLMFQLRWKASGLEVRVCAEYRYGDNGDNWKICNQQYYFQKGIAIAMIGSGFGARVHRFASAFDSMGTSLFPCNVSDVVELLNESRSRAMLESLNPTIHFQVGDVNRLPLYDRPNSGQVFSLVEAAFTTHESHREPSVEFRQSGPSAWRAAQAWAQVAVDRPENSPLPEYVEELDPEPPTDHVSFALGVALGRFDANGEGILDPRNGEPTALAAGIAAADSRATPDSSIVMPDASAFGSLALPHGILFLDGTLDGHDLRDSLGHPAAKLILETWETYGPDITSGKKQHTPVRDWLREKFFSDEHRQMYENRPIHWPLSSAKKTFVAWVTIHRWDESTLRVLLADHLAPTLTRLDGELDDLRQARDGADPRAARAAADRFSDVKKWREELADFIAQVEQCADHGPPPTSPDAKKCPPREVDASYAPDLDDGVMINSAALWPLLAPQWKDPQKWWTELALSKGKKDYDWSHLAMRYWPTRVDEKCQQDPSLGVAHGCFWKYHPARAWAWELRLQAEIGPDFRIEEAPYRGDGGDEAHRNVFIADHPEKAIEAVEKEVKRRLRKHDEPLTEMRLLEPGIWSAEPYRCYELELTVLEKQGVEFRLLAPDEPESRAKHEAANPAHVELRKSLLARAEEKLLFPDAQPAPKKKRKKATKKKATRKKKAAAAEIESE